MPARSPKGTQRQAARDGTLVKQPPDFCANCGAALPRNARACPECGADERTGWAESDIYDGIDLPADSEMDAGDRVHAEKRSLRSRVFGVIAVLLALGLLVILVRGL